MSISKSRGALYGAAAVVVVAAAAVVAGVTITHSSGGPAAPGGTVAVAGYPAGTVYTATPAARDKQQLVTRTLAAEPSAMPAAQKTRTLNHNEWLYADGSKLISPAGRSGQIRVSGQTLATVPFWDIQKNRAKYSQSSSVVAWLGTSPVNADTVTQTDNWATSTYGGSSPKVSGAPPGAVLAAPGSLVWKSRVSHNWISLHTWNGTVSVSTTGVVYDVGYSVTGTFQFGSSFFTVSGQDAAGV